MKLLITGGHITPALAVIDELKKTKKNIQVVFVGRKYTSEKTKDESLEYKEIKKRDILFIHLKTGRFTRTVSIATLVNILRIPSGFYQAYRALKKNKPDRVLSFGGYIALPIAVVASLMRIPVFTHEQTIEPGLSNRAIGRFAKKIFLSFKESKKYFKRKSTEFTGNPVREQIKKVIEKPFTLKKTKPTIYITGGSLGSHSINVLIEEVLPELLEEYTLIHQAGNVKEYSDYERLKNYAKTLPQELHDRYFLFEHFSTEELGYIYSVSDLVIGRSGANTFFELLELEKPAIFIPLPWSAHKEQQKQAELYKRKGLGEVFYQTGKSKDLLSLIHATIEGLDNYQKQFKNTDLSYARNAAQTIIKIVVG